MAKTYVKLKYNVAIIIKKVLCQTWHIYNTIHDAMVSYIQTTDLNNMIIWYPGMNCVLRYTFLLADSNFLSL